MRTATTGFRQLKALDCLMNEALVISDQTYLCVHKGLNGRFPKKEKVVMIDAPPPSQKKCFSCS